MSRIIDYLFYDYHLNYRCYSVNLLYISLASHRKLVICAQTLVICASAVDLFEIIPLESGWPEFGWFCTRQTHILPPPVLSHPESEPGVKALNLSQVVCLKPLFWINDPSRVAQIPPRVVSLAFHYAVFVTLHTLFRIEDKEVFLLV